MKRYVLLGMVLLGLQLSSASWGQEPEKVKRPGDKRHGEEEEILMREEWFAHTRGLDEISRPGDLRRKAVEDVKFSLFAKVNKVVAFSWQAMGPSPMNMLSWAMGRVAGRVSALAVDPSNEQTLYLGAASGGLWRSVDGGSFWSPLFDSVGTETIGSVAIDPNNAGNIWVGTGEQGRSCTDYFGMGLFRSSDGGASFQDANGSGATALGLSNVTAVAVQPGNSSLVLAGGPGVCSGGGLSGAGVRRSTDGGLTWSLVLSGQPNDILFDPLTPSIVYAAIGGGTTFTCGVFKSTDSGATWTRLTNGLSVPAYSLVRLAMAPTNRQILYTLFQTSDTAGTLSRTLDGGASWSTRSTAACEGQCWYNLTVDVSPASSDTVLVGSIRIFRSTNGGTTLSALTNGWGSGQQVHQDTHVVRYSRTNGSRFWIGSDGGLWRTDNGGTNYVNLNGNLNITQFYDITVHPNDTSRVWGGAQDNSSETRSTSSIWDVVFVTGDGMNNLVDPGNLSYVFIESYSSSGSPGPHIYRSTNGGGSGSFSQISNSGISNGFNNFPWKPAIALIPTNTASYLFTGSTYLFRTSARGTISWSQIASQLAGTGVLSAFGTTPTSGGTLYAGFDNGRIFRTSNATISTVVWSEVTGNYPGGFVSAIAVDPTSQQRVFVTRSAFGGNKLFRSTTGGTTWAAVGNGLPDVPANSVAIDPVNLQRIFVATDVGVFVSEDNGDNFAPQMAGLPQGTVVSDLEADNSPHVLTAGTYGRGAWQLSLPVESPACIPDGGVDDSGSVTSCCSGLAVTGSQFCYNSSDFSTCYQICATPLVGGCVPSGGIDDTLGSTSCCSGAAVPGSTWCLNPADWGNGWASCIQTCQ